MGRRAVGVQRHLNSGQSYTARSDLPDTVNWNAIGRCRRASDRSLLTRDGRSIRMPQTKLWYGYCLTLWDAVCASYPSMPERRRQKAIVVAGVGPGWANLVSPGVVMLDCSHQIADTNCTSQRTQKSTGTRVAVVIPNRNHAHFLNQAIGAWANQTRAADEIIIIDDASSDNSLEVIEAWQARLKNLSLIRNQTQTGIVAALNLGIRSTEADLIAFSAADDAVMPRFLGASIAALELDPRAAFAAGIAQLVDHHDKFIGLRPAVLPSIQSRYVSGDDFRRLLMRGDNYFLGGVTLYRRKSLVELGGFDPALRGMADGMIARRMASRWGFCFVPEVLGHWRIHPSNSNYSASQVTTEESFAAMAMAASSTVDSEPAGTFPRGYREALDRRLRFGRIRLMISQPRLTDAQVQIVTRLLGGGTLDGTILDAARHLGPIRKLALLTWSAFRLRPYSLQSMLVEPFRKRIALRHPLTMKHLTRRDAETAKSV